MCVCMYVCVYCINSNHNVFTYDLITLYCFKYQYLATLYPITYIRRNSIYDCYV